MTRKQILVLVGLGVGVLIIAISATALLLQSAASVPTIPAATVPPHSQLQTRVPLCQQVVESALEEHGLAGRVTLDPQRATLDVWLSVQPESAGELPAGQIWAAFEAVLAGRAAGCSGYAELTVRIGVYRAQVALEDLLAWESGEMDDGAFGQRVILTY